MEGCQRTRLLVVSMMYVLECKLAQARVHSLKNHGADEEVNAMFDMGETTMALPLDEKMKYEQGDDGMSFGYALVSFN